MNSLEGIAELRRLREKASTGTLKFVNFALPAVFFPRGDDSSGVIATDGEARNEYADCNYLVALWNAAPDLLDRLELLEQKAERYREALEFYANEKNYDDETGAPGKAMLASGPMEPVEYEFDPDMGARARAALEGSGRAEGSE